MNSAGYFDVDCEMAEVGHIERGEEQPAIRVGIDAHAFQAPRRRGSDGFMQAAVMIEELLRLIGPKPFIKKLQVFRIGANFFKRHLMGSPGTLHLLSVDNPWPGPAFGGAQ